ncbi:MAG: sensor histidine kinase, partial [Rhodoferax sp.]
AHTMVGHLIQYLRNALPKMRESISTVGQEVELVRAYLNILQMRMGERLQFSISADAAVLGQAFPPMMLPSLVENAVKHGLEPLREGGCIEVRVEQLQTSTGARLVVCVQDNGKGLVETPVTWGAGVGLSNVRERLAGLYQGQARFSLEARTPRGVVARIEIPCGATSGVEDAAEPTRAAPAPGAARSGFRRILDLTSRSHSVWVRVLSRTLVLLMVALCVLFLLALLGLYTGQMPVHVGDLQLDGIEGMAVGSVGLLAAFGGIALAILVVVALIYGLGFLFAALAIAIPALILVSLFPVFSPLVLLGLLIYWAMRRHQRTPPPH